MPPLVNARFERASLSSSLHTNKLAVCLGELQSRASRGSNAMRATSYELRVASYELRATGTRKRKGSTGGSKGGVQCMLPQRGTPTCTPSWRKHLTYAQGGHTPAKHNPPYKPGTLPRSRDRPRSRCRGYCQRRGTCYKAGSTSHASHKTKTWSTGDPE